MIEAHRLTMYYGSVVALQDATFDVHKGEVVGLLGPNGAGKSTTMKILTTYLYPSAGTAKVGGYSVTEDPIAVRKVIGYLPEVLPLYMNMETCEYLTFVGRARGLCGQRLRSRLAWVTERCGLASVYRKPIRELSKGFKQRTALAQALIHDPEVVILDEPTSGLDPHQILEIRGLVRELAQTKTVILSTHILQEAEAMSDRIIIINRGRIVGEGTLDELRVKAHETARVRVAVRAPAAEIEKSLSRLDGIREKKLLSERDGIARFELLGSDAQAMVFGVGIMAKEQGQQIVELMNAPYSLEETFLALTEADRN